MKKIWTIIRKEWAEVFKNRMVLFTVAFLPLVMTVLPLGILYTMRGSGTAVDSSAAQALGGTCAAGLSGSECFTAAIISQFMLLFMLLPAIIPATIAAYSIVGEKVSRSLEPLLATPITTTELLVGKGLAAVIPAVLATFAAYTIYAVGTLILAPGPHILGVFFEFRWLAAIFLVGPLMAVMAVGFCIMVSSRVNNPRVAEQLSMIVILPALFLFFSQVSNLVRINQQIILLIVAVMAALDVGLGALVVRIFQRENILTRWK
jgi:ABC-2 type transport system permease protein